MNLFFNIKYISFKKTIWFIAVMHLIILIFACFLFIWCLIYLLINSQAQNIAISGYYWIFIALLFTISTCQISKIFASLLIFFQEVNITNKFKWFIFLETLINPFGITITLYKVLTSNIFYLIKHKKIKALKGIFPEQNKCHCLLSINNISYKYHGDNKWDILIHHIIKFLNKDWYINHMKKTNNLLKTDHDIDEYYNFNVLNSITFDIQKGKFVAIVGFNGSGKSTLLKIINNVISNYSGEIFWWGKNSKSISIKSFSENVSYLSQNIVAHSNITVYDYIALSIYKSTHNTWGYVKEQNNKVILDILKKLDLLKLKDTYLSNLSGGELQRAAIAYVLSRKSKIIILDEPTNHLDIFYKKLVLNLLKEIQNKEGATIIIILHNSKDIEEYADEVILLDAGSVYLKGKTKYIFNEKNLRDIYQKN